MEPKLPDWLNNEFLTKCLQHKEGRQTIAVTTFTASSAAPAGDNYGSVVFRVRAEYNDDSNTHSTSLIVKTDHVEGAMKGMFTSDYKEPMFNYEFVPKIKKFIKTDFLPDSFYSPLSNALILEDLKVKGFVMSDRKKSLDFEHCCLYLSTAASIHAASVAVHKEDPMFMEITIAKENCLRGTFVESNFSLKVKAFIDVIKGNKNF